MKLEDLEAKLGISDLSEAEKLALVKDIQANLPALRAEQMKLESKTQAQMVIAAVKKIQENVEIRFNELSGFIESKTASITSGKDGIQGPKGDQGDRGLDGAPGIQGPRGVDGKDGQDGEQGVGVADARVDFDGSLVITLTDGKEINAGEVLPLETTEKLKVYFNNPAPSGGGAVDSVNGLTGTVVLKNNDIQRVVSVSDAASITINADTTDVATQVNTQAIGTLTINAPTGTPINGQKIVLRLQSTNVQTFSWNSIFAGSTDLALPTASSGSSKYDYVGFIYNSTAAKWQLLAKVFGF
jgi:hypothetical protein